MSWIRGRRPSPALIISVIALIIALGGTGYAALKVPKKSVGTKQLKANAVKNPKVADAAIGTAELQNGAVTNPKLADGAVTNPKLAAGAVTKQSLGNQAVGANQFGTIIARVDTVTVANNTGAAITVPCAAGEKLISGGARFIANVNQNAFLTSTRAQTPADADAETGETVDRWRAAGKNNSGVALDFRVWAYCLQP
jgi:hypothetical protein